MLSKESFGDTSEAVIRRSPDNEIVKKKKDKGKTIIYKTLHRKSVAVNHGQGGDSKTCTLVLILNIAEIYFTLYRQQYTN